LGNKLYVGNLGVQTTAEDLTALFAGAGHVVSAHLITDRETGQAKGFAFVEMANDAEALHAIALYNGHPLYDQALVVSEARPRESQRASPQASPAASPKFREVKHKRRGGANRNRFH
jgi:RNA recognition motif-containing protein